MGAQGYLKAIKKEQIIKWMRTQSYLRFLDVQKYLKKQYDVALDILESCYSLLREGGMTWIKTHSQKSC